MIFEQSFFIQSFKDDIYETKFPLNRREMKTVTARLPTETPAKSFSTKTTVATDKINNISYASYIFVYFIHSCRLRN